MSKNLSLEERLEAALNRIVELEAIIAQLIQRNAELERQLGLNSKNSSKPPSSDGFQKAAINRTQSLREKTDRKVGGQQGHKGSTLMQIKNPDEIKQYKTVCCPDCKIDLTDAPVVKVIKRQVFDLPEIKPVVTEHQFDFKTCPSCKKKVEAQSDNTIKAPVQYGNAAKAFVSYMGVEQLIPQERITSILKIVGLPMSTATINHILQTGATLVKPSVKNIETDLKIVAYTKNLDETMLNVEGEGYWVHVISNGNATYYHISKKRGDVPKDLKGVIVHDHFISYFSQISNVLHALCNSHHLRQLIAVKELDKESWAELMVQLLLLCNDYKKKLHIVPLEIIQTLREVYFDIIDVGLKYHENLGPLKKPPRGKIKRRPGHNLLLRLKDFASDVLRFLSDPCVPFTNNQAEQDIRMIKVKQKISGGFRTFSGAQSFLTLKSYTETAKKNNVNILHALFAAFQKKPIIF